MADAVAIFTPGQRLAGPDGTPLNGGSAEFYASGTDDPLIVYADSNLTVELGTVVYTDSAGYPVTASGGSTKTLVFTGTAKWKVVLKDAAGVPYATHDGNPGAVVGSGGVGSGGGITQAQGDVRYVRNPNALVLESTIDDADLDVFWDTSASANKAWTYAARKAKLTTDFQADGRMFPVGTRLAFQQTTPPTGWTKETNAFYNDATLRFTTGAASVGGSAGFSTVFTSRTFTGTVGNDTPNQAKMALHDHEFGSPTAGSSSAGAITTISASGVTYNTSTKGSSTAHNHTLTMNAENFAVKYADFSIGTKA